MNRKGKKFIDDLVAELADEDLVFNMGEFVDGVVYADDYAPLATCDTARCIAGHIVAIRPELAELYRDAQMAEQGFWYYDGLASRIYRHETGDAFCPLDFYAMNRRGHGLSGITREEAIDHVRGVDRNWPQLTHEQARDLYKGSGG